MLRSNSSPGTDHQIHVNIIDRIKANKHHFLDNYILSLNEKYAWYPQLYHWMLSFLPEKIYKEKYQYVNIAVKVFDIAAFNLFLFFLYKRIGFDEILFLYANIVINAFPFSYAIWNAKNIGISGRGIGLLAGQIYTYLIVAYILTGNLLLLLAIFATIFIILLLSLMAMQYVWLSLIFFVVFFKIPEIIPLPFLTYVLFFLVMPKVAKNNIIGQFNHKRNYALYDAESFILKNRPSIYRDFVYDFWIKLREKFIGGLSYIFFNPLVEIIYGLPFLWFVIYFGAVNGFESEFRIMFLIIISALGVFLLTSLAWTRFLGEPQRYLEFVIPIITILFVLHFELVHHIILVAICVIFIFLSSFFLNKYDNSNSKYVNRNAFVDFLKNENKYRGKICISNDNELLKFFLGVGMEIVRPDASIFINNKVEYFKNYYNNSLYIHSPIALEGFYNKFKVDLIVLNTDFYDLETLSKTFKPQKINLVKRLGKFELYEL